MAVKDFIVLGAGISGLTAAYELLKKGEKVTILEKDPHVGGLARTVNLNGTPIDYGPHLFHSAHEEIVHYWRNLVGNALVEKEFYAGNYQKGKIFDYPVNRETISSQYTDFEIERIENELNCADMSKLASAKNYHEYVRVLAGNFLAEKFFTAYPEKLWGMDTKDLSAKFAPRRIEIRDRRRPFHSGKGRFAGIIEGGCGELAEQLLKKIINLGGKLKLNSEVIAVKSGGNNKSKRISALVINDNETISTTNSIIISTLPITKSAEFFDINTTLYFRSILLVAIVIEGPDRFPEHYDWLYFDDKKIPFHRAGMQTRFSRKGVKDGRQVICCEIVFDEKISDKKLNNLKSQTISELIKLNFIKETEVVDVFGIDIGPVYPGYFNGYEAEYARVSGLIGSFGNHYLLGSLAEYSYADLQILTAKSIDLASEIVAVNQKIPSDMVRSNKITRPANEIKFGNKIISKELTENVFLIAEIGLSHNGSVQVCKQLIDESVAAGFDAVKIQTYSEGRLSKKTRTARYFEETLDQEESLSEYLSKIIFTRADLVEIQKYCEQKNIIFFSTPFDIESLSVLEGLNCPGFKISSMDIVNRPLIQAIAKTQKPVIISTGMASFGEIEDAIQICLHAGNEKLMILHCVSSYPCPLELANLSKIKRLSDAFGVITGYSDHTVECETPALSVIAGARIIEKHVTLNKGMDGPDQHFSLNPDEMRRMVGLVRKAEASINYHQLDESSAELSSKQNLRRSIYTSCSLGPGDMLTSETMAIKSPGDGIPARYFELLLGRRILRHIDSDSPLSWDDVLNR